MSLHADLYISKIDKGKITIMWWRGLFVQAYLRRVIFASGKNTLFKKVWAE